MVVGSVRRDQLPPVEGLVDREVSVGPAAGSPRHLGGRRRLLTESSPPLRPTPLPQLLGRGLYSRHFSLYIFCRGLAGRCFRSWTGQDVVAVLLFLSFRPLGALFLVWCFRVSCLFLSRFFLFVFDGRAPPDCSSSATAHQTPSASQPPITPLPSVSPSAPSWTSALTPYMEWGSSFLTARSPTAACDYAFTSILSMPGGLQVI